MPVRKKPAPRVFCDICDVFDDHETEDCPVQCSVDPPPRTKAKKLPAPRMFCEHCDGNYIPLSTYFSCESLYHNDNFFASRI